MILVLTCESLLSHAITLWLQILTFLLVQQVNQKMILTLTASIMYWSLQRQPQSQSEMPEQSEPSSMTSDAASDIASEDGASTTAPSESEEVNSLSDSISNLTMDDATSNAPPAENGNGVEGS
jgi:plastin-1